MPVVNEPAAGNANINSSDPIESMRQNVSVIVKETKSCVRETVTCRVTGSVVLHWAHLSETMHRDFELKPPMTSIINQTINRQAL
jgi:hypothetical protein